MIHFVCVCVCVVCYWVVEVTRRVLSTAPIIKESALENLVVGIPRLEKTTPKGYEYWRL